MGEFALISIGAIVGANLRYWIVNSVAARIGAAFPWGTLLVNVSGSFLIGLALTWIANRAEIDESYRLLIGTGFLGAYTTFSAFSIETVALLEDGALGLALLNGMASVVGSVVAAYLGIAVARAFL